MLIKECDQHYIIKIKFDVNFDIKKHQVKGRYTNFKICNVRNASNISFINDNAIFEHMTDEEVLKKFLNIRYITPEEYLQLLVMVK